MKVHFLMQNTAAHIYDIALLYNCTNALLFFCTNIILHQNVYNQITPDWDKFTPDILHDINFKYSTPTVNAPHLLVLELSVEIGRHI